MGIEFGFGDAADQMGADIFYRYVRAFGFGSLTGIDLAGEAWGQVWLPQDVENWHDSNLGTNAFGQGLAVTPLQLATALATIANDGVRLRPRIVAEQIAPDGEVITSEPAFEQCSATLFTEGELAQAEAGLALVLVADDSAYEYERSHLPEQAWPPTEAYPEWALGQHMYALDAKACPIGLRWRIYEKRAPDG